MNFESFTFCPNLTSGVMQRWLLTCPALLFALLLDAPLLNMRFLSSLIGSVDDLAFATFIRLPGFTLDFFMRFSDRLKAIHDLVKHESIHLKPSQLLRPWVQAKMNLSIVG